MLNDQFSDELNIPSLDIKHIQERHIFYDSEFGKNYNWVFRVVLPMGSDALYSHWRSSLKKFEFLELYLLKSNKLREQKSRLIEPCRAALDFLE